MLERRSTDRAAPVSVIVPTYNRADLIGETLDSIAAQTFPDWECVVVDDGSTDDTRLVVEQRSETDRRFRYVRQQNAGASAARNRGIAEAQGRYIAFVDSDDHFAPDRLEWQVAVLDADPEVVLVYGNTLRCHSDDMRSGRVYLQEVVDKPSGWAFEELLSCSSIYAPLVRADAIRRLGGFDESLRYAEDWDMWIRLSKVGRIHFDPRVHLYYREHEGNRTRAPHGEYVAARRVLRRHLADVPVMERLRIRRRALPPLRRYAPRLLEQATAATDAGDWAAARRVYRDVALLDPRVLSYPGAIADAAWAFLPIAGPPPWRRSG